MPCPWRIVLKPSGDLTVLAITVTAMTVMCPRAGLSRSASTAAPQPRLINLREESSPFWSEVGVHLIRAAEFIPNIRTPGAECRYLSRTASLMITYPVQNASMVSPRPAFAWVSFNSTDAHHLCFIQRFTSWRQDNSARENGKLIRLLRL